MVTWSDEDGQVPFEIVHWKTFAPIDKPVTPEELEDGEVTVPVPEIVVHTPLPVAGAFPPNVAAEEHKV